MPAVGVQMSDRSPTIVERARMQMHLAVVVGEDTEPGPAETLHQLVVCDPADVKVDHISHETPDDIHTGTPKPHDHEPAGCSPGTGRTLRGAGGSATPDPAHERTPSQQSLSQHHLR